MIASTATERVQKRLKEVLSGGQAQLEEVLMGPLQGLGKMLRPRLVLLSRGLLGPIEDLTVDVAVAVECIHNASLIHDDIIDAAVLRRGAPTINHLYGPKIAVLVGDHYFAAAFGLLTRHNLKHIMRELSDAIQDMCKGEIYQDLNLFNPYITEDDYWASIFGKTASLFSAACRCGVMAGGGSAREVYLMGKFGRELGYAYQVADDINDLIGDEEKMGKPAGTDLVNGVITLPVIRALKISPERELISFLILSRRIYGSDLKKVIALIEECGAFEYAACKVKAKVEKAKEVLAAFRDCPARDELIEMADSIISMLPAGLAGRIEGCVDEEEETCVACHPLPGYVVT